MSRGEYIKLLLYKIHHLGLAERKPAIFKPILLAAQAGILTDDIARAMLIRHDKIIKRFERIRNCLPAPPEVDELPDCDITLGRCFEAPDRPLGIRILDRPRHMLVSGGTGQGKSSMLRRLCQEIDHLNRTTGRKIAVVVLDQKGDFSAIPYKMGRDLWGHHSVHGYIQAGLNPPKDMAKHLTRWIDKVVEIVAARCDLKHSAGSLAALMKLGAGELSKNAANQVLVPNIGLLCDMVAHEGSKRLFGKSQYRGTVNQVLGELHATAGPLLGAMVGFDVNAYVNQGRSVVIDMTFLSTKLRYILIDLIVSQLLWPRIAMRRMMDTTEVLLIVDEGDGICSIDANNAYEELSPLGIYLKQGREFGLMACLSVTHLSQISAMIRTNVTYHYYFAQPDPASLSAVMQVLQLPREGMRQPMALDPGQCIHLEAPGKLPIPILMEVEHLPPSRDPLPLRYDTHPVVRGRRLYEVPTLKAALDRLLPPPHTKKKYPTPPESQSATISQPARTLMLAKSLHIWHPVARLWEKTEFKLSREAQNKVRQELEDAKLAEFAMPRIGSHDQLLIELTESGWAYIRAKPPKRSGRGGIEHQHMAHWIAMALVHRGLKPELEWIVPGTSHPADVACRRDDGHYDAWEVVSSSDKNLPSHILACFANSNAVAQLSIVVIQKQAIRPLHKQLNADPNIAPYLDHIVIETIEPYLKEAMQ